MQNIQYFKPNGSLWEMKDHHDVNRDTSTIVTHPVRRYFHREHVQYTILACADYRTPYNIFYDLEVSRPYDIEFPVSPYKDMRIFRQLIKEFPVSEQAYIKAENKLRKKIDEARFKSFQERRLKFVEKNRMELMERTRIEMLAKQQNDLIEKKANEYVESLAKISTNTTELQKVVDNVIVAENVVQIMMNPADDDINVADDDNKASDDKKDDDNMSDDDDECAGGILGVYARSD